MTIFERLNITVGADPEVFATDDKGKYISLVHKIGGTKECPLPFGPGFALQEDNVSVEFNIPPARTLDEFRASISHAMNEVERRLEKMKLNVSIVASANFEEDQLDTVASRTAGCMPDFNAWTGMPNTPPDLVGGLRAAAGHVHIGYDQEKMPIDKRIIVRCLDVFLGSVLAMFDPDTERMKLYGMPGAYRDKPYGLEYRVPSNNWLSGTSLQDLVYQQVGKAFEYLEKHPEETFNDVESVVVRCICDHDGNAAADLAKFRGE